MSGAFKITVTKEDLVFAAAHFITLPGHRCEALHGHNYRVGAVVEGGLEPETWFVVDFIALKRLLKQLTEELDHRVLDAYVARRLAQESAARAEAERRSAEAISGLRGEEPPGPATGFYLLLGVIVAALLLAVIWLSAGSPPPH